MSKYDPARKAREEGAVADAKGYPLAAGMRVYVPRRSEEPDGPYPFGHATALNGRITRVERTDRHPEGEVTLCSFSNGALHTVRAGACLAQFGEQEFVAGDGSKVQAGTRDEFHQKLLRRRYERLLRPRPRGQGNLEAFR